VFERSVGSFECLVEKLEMVLGVILNDAKCTRGVIGVIEGRVSIH